MNHYQSEEEPTPGPHTPEAGNVPTPTGEEPRSVWSGTSAEPGSLSPGGMPGAGDARPAMSARIRPRPPWWLVAVLVVVGVGVGVGAGALIWAGQVKNVYPPGFHALSPAEYDRCVRGVIISFGGPDPDSAMREAAAQLRDDERFDSVREETRQQAYKRFKETFADQPDLVDNARPEALPASVKLMVRKGSMAKDLKGALQDEFSDAEVVIQDWCPAPE
ncbi:permease-like cell division protein FtsX [Actinophytocola sp.]|uniref:permease-like cell division protein FtsX n=1 Tax=Actinophytocola sp. TaxID=1872138 RepID=UPI002D6AA6AB|nr:permease-like cell division protein FtsX [Actinophytocola sp.]HYQ61882.1 permease-like cell division protein FtsX [Actinophytocola sp.]